MNLFVYIVKETSAYSGKEILRKEEVVYSPYPPSFFLAKGPSAFFNSLLENIKAVFSLKIYVYHIDDYQSLVKKYFSNIEKMFGAGVLMHKQISSNKRFMKFTANPKISLCVFFFIDLILLLLIGLIIKVSNFSNIRINSQSVIMSFFVLIFFLAILWITFYYIMIYFRVVRPLEKRFN